MTTPNHELIYFDAPGRAESIRIMLHAAGVDFTDTRVAGKDWPAVKASTPLGSVPVLKIDDVQHTQSLALARYAANLAGFYPANDPLKALVVDEVMETINEMSNKAPQDPDEEVKKKKRQEWQSTGLTKYADYLEKQIQTFGAGKSVVDTPSFADVGVKTLVGMIQGGFFDYVDTDFFDKYPGIM